MLEKHCISGGYTTGGGECGVEWVGVEKSWWEKSGRRNVERVRMRV